MGVALWLVWQHGWSKKKVQKAIMVFTIQLFLNVLWSLIFFGLHSPGGAFLEIICLWLGIIITILAFARISKTAAYLLLPYLAWVSFAAYLNFSIWSLN
jgi:tryptophan-rich sensory protein